MLKGLFSLAWSEGTTRLVPASGNRNGRVTSSSWPSSLQEPFSWPCSSWPSFPFSSLPFFPPRNWVHPTSPSLLQASPTTPPHAVPISNEVPNCQMRNTILENFFYSFSHSIQTALRN